jgi:hypothetical protein
MNLRTPEIAARDEALAQLSTIGTAGQHIALEPDDVLCALGRDLRLTSVNGLFYNTLGTMCRFLRPLGTLLVLTIGLVATVRIVVRGAYAVTRKIASVMSVVSTITSASLASSPFGALWSLFGLGAKKDGDPESPDEVLEIVKAVVPGPIVTMFNMVDQALEASGFLSGGGLQTQAASAPGTPPPPAALTASVAPGGGSLLSPFGSVGTAPAAAPQTAAVAPRSAPAEVPFWQQAAVAMLPALGTAIGSIFGDEDDNITGTTGITRDEAVTQRCAALALAAGVPIEAVRAACTTKDEAYTSGW